MSHLKDVYHTSRIGPWTPSRDCHSPCTHGCPHDEQLD